MRLVEHRGLKLVAEDAADQTGGYQGCKLELWIRVWQPDLYQSSSEP